MPVASEGARDRPRVEPDVDLVGDRPMPAYARTALQLTVALLVVYVILDAVAQLLPPHYSAIAQAESDLAVGPYGYVMTVNFVVRGVLSLAFLIGLGGATNLGKKGGSWLIGAWAVGAFILAASPTDVGPGPATVHGMVHLATAALAFLLVVLGELWLSYDFRGEPRLASLRPLALAVAAVTALLLVVLAVVQARPHLASEAFGLAERLFLAGALLWILLVSVHLLRGARPRATAVLGN